MFIGHDAVKPSQLSWLERGSNKPKVVGSIPTASNFFDLYDQYVRIRFFSASRTPMTTRIYIMQTLITKKRRRNIYKSLRFGLGPDVKGHSTINVAIISPTNHLPQLPIANELFWHIFPSHWTTRMMEQISMLLENMIASGLKKKSSYVPGECNIAVEENQQSIPNGHPSI